MGPREPVIWMVIYNIKISLICYHVLTVTDKVTLASFVPRVINMVIKMGNINSSFETLEIQIDKTL